MEQENTNIKFKDGVMRNIRSLDRAIIASLILLFSFVVSSQGRSGELIGVGIILMTLCSFCLLMFLEISYNFFNASKTSFKEMRYRGSLDDLVKKLSSLGIEPRTRIGKTYVFKTSTNLLPKKTIFVKDMDGACEIYGLYLDNICRLEKETAINEIQNPNRNTKY